MTQETKSSKEKKIAGSGYRVLEILKALCNAPLTPNELLLGIEEVSDNVYRKEVVIKYLNTLKLMGFKISKKNNKYILEKSIERIDFSRRDLSMLKYLQEYTADIHMQTLSDNISEALQTAEKSFSENTLKTIKRANIKPYRPKKKSLIKDENVKQFEKYCIDGLKLEISYKCPSDLKEKDFKIAPLKIAYKKGKAVLICYDCVANEYKEFAVQYITYAEQTPQKNTKDYPSAVTFKLKNRLAKSYVPKKDERVITYAKDFIVVSNSKEDRDMLLKRLIRYYDQCEILYPKNLREKMLKLTEDIEKIYE